MGSYFIQVGGHSLRSQPMTEVGPSSRFGRMQASMERTQSHTNMHLVVSNPLSIQIAINSRLRFAGQQQGLPVAFHTLEFVPRIPFPTFLEMHRNHS